MDKPPHLTLVTPTHTPTEHDQEFIPLPFYGWSERPATLPLDQDECATAIHIARGDLPAAAALLKIPQYKLERQIRRHPNLQRILNEELQIAVSKSRSELLTALDSPSERRREWAATKILASRIAQSDPFAPAPAGSQTSSNVTINQESKEIIIHWGDAPALLDNPSTSHHDGGSEVSYDDDERR